MNSIVVTYLYQNDTNKLDTQYYTYSVGVIIFSSRAYMYIENYCAHTILFTDIG